MVVMDESNPKPGAGKIFHGLAGPDTSEYSKKYNSLGHYLLTRLETDNKDKVIFTDFNSGRSWTGQELREKILNVSHALVNKYALKPGQAACIAYDNKDETQILALGLICAGAVVGCSYPKDPYAELLYLARKVRPKFLFCHGKNRIKWGEQLSHDLGYDVISISMDPGPEHEPNNLSSLLNYDRSQSSAILPCPVRDLKKQVALITMSSGTTGKPKGVPVTHYNCINELLQGWMNAKSSSEKYKQLNFACFSSLDYVSGRLILFGAINVGYNAVILDGFEPELCAKAIEKHRIHIIYLGAASFYNLITWPNVDKYDFSSIFSIFPMGAKIIYLKELGDFLAKRPNIRQIRQGFGASEIGGAAMNSLSPEEYLKDCENCGPLIPGTSAKIVDPSTGALLGTNQVGMVHIKSDTNFPGYYDMERKLTESNSVQENLDEPPIFSDSSVFDEDGYYITGDLGYFNYKEELYIIGRQKELMSCRGAKKVLPQELEDILNMHPAVNKVCVLGIPSKSALLLHCPRAFVAPIAECLEKPEKIEQIKKQRVKVETLNEELEQELRELCLNKQLRHSGNDNTKLCSLPSSWRRRLAEDLMEYMNERVGWEKQLTGGIVLLDEIPTSRATGKMDKNYLRSLSTDQVEIFGDQSS